MITFDEETAYVKFQYRDLKTKSEHMISLIAKLEVMLFSSES